MEQAGMHISITGDDKDLEKAVKKSEETLKNFNSKVGGTVKNIGEMRREYRALSNTSLVGKSPQEVADITKRLATLRDRIGDTQRTINSLSGDPFEKLGESVQSASTMMAGLTGAMTILGGEEKQMQELMQKTIGLMAIAKAAQEATIFLNERAHGIMLKNKVKEIALRMKEALTINTVTAATVAETGAKTKGVGVTGLITKAQLLWNKAVASNPIMLLVAALAALAAGVGYLVSRYKESTNATEDYNKAVDGTIIRNKELRQSYNEHVRAMARVKDEIKLIRGEITQFEFDMLDMDRQFTSSMDVIENESKESLGEVGGFFSGVLQSALLSLGLTSKAVQVNTDKISGIIDEKRIKEKMAIDKHEAEKNKMLEKALADRRAIELNSQQRLIEDLGIRRLDGITKELAQLKLSYERGLKEWEGFEKAKTELTLTYEHERAEIVKKAMDEAQRGIKAALASISKEFESDKFKIEPIDVKIEWDLDFADAEMVVLQEKVYEITDMLNQAISQGMADLAGSIAEGLGAMAAGEASMDDVVGKIAGSVANFMDTLGKSLIASGIAGEAFKKLLTNPAAAIIAGGALVGLAAFTRAKLAKGPAATAPMPAKAGGGGSSASSDVFGSRNLRDFKVEVTGEFKLKGNDLIGAINNENKRKSL